MEPGGLAKDVPQNSDLIPQLLLLKVELIAVTHVAVV
jgi:hypothetical protein